jgi:hypothetical protein
MPQSPPQSHVAPRPYGSANGAASTSPPVPPPSPPRNQSGWPAPRPFGVNDSPYGGSPPLYGLPKVSTAPQTAAPKQASPTIAQASPPRNWAAATFEPTPAKGVVNTAEQGKMAMHAISEPSTGSNVVNGRPHDNVNGQSKGDGI